MKRRQFLKNTSVALAATLTGCGGGDDAAAVQDGSAPAPPAPAPAPPPGAGPSFRGLPTLTLHPTQTGSGPYSAAVLPLEGLVPAGQSLDSPDDPSVRSTVISTWPDGSASVIVVTGETSVTARSFQTDSPTRSHGQQQSTNASQSRSTRFQRDGRLRRSRRRNAECLRRAGENLVGQ